MNVSAPPRSQAQVEASRRNGRLSVGPVSATGKFKVSSNGVVHGLRSERVVLPHEDPARYAEHVQAWVDCLKPADEAELEVVVTIADVRWRLQRVDAVELNRTRAEASADADETSELKFLHLIENAAQATAVMAEVLPSPKVHGDQGLQGLLAAVRSVIDMVKAVEAEQPKLFLGAQQLADAVDAAEGISFEDIGGTAYQTLLDRAVACAKAVAGQLEPARARAEMATKQVAATVPLPDGKQVALLARYRRDLERRLASEMSFLAAVRDRKVQVAGSSGLLGQPVPIRLVG
jgi:hypothetical protein